MISTSRGDDDRARSVDVVITRAIDDAKAGADEEQELTIQILVIDVPKLQEP